MIRALQHPGIDGCPPEASDTCLGRHTPPDTPPKVCAVSKKGRQLVLLPLQ